MGQRAKQFIIWAFVILIAGGALVWASQHSPARAPLAAHAPVATVSIGHLAPVASFASLDGATTTLASFRGKKVMLWLVATWCSSCSAGAQVLASHINDISGLTVIALQTYKNDGYPGPNMKEFATASAPKTLTNKNWVFGYITKASSAIYNPTHYADIYYLIDAKGVVRVISGAPAATLSTITAFAKK